MNTIRFGIIGTGSIADFHAEAIRQTPGATLVAVTNRSFPKAQAFAARHGTTAEPDLAAFLSRSDIDAVCVTTPSGEHAAVAVEALNAGKHLLCEKPLDISLPRIDAMLAAARRNRRLLSAVFQARFGEGAQTLKTAIDAGRFGRLTLCNCQVRYWRDQAYYDNGAWRGTWAGDGGGALMNQGIHAVDLLQWLLGMPEAVCAQTGTLVHERIETEDTAAALLRFPSGAIGVIEAATSTWPGFSRRLQISGEHGSATLENDRLTFWQFRQESDEDARIRERGKEGAAIVSGASDPRAINAEGHRRQIEDLARAIRTGQPPAIDGAEGRNAVAIILGIYESVRTGGWVNPACLP
ncbi:MAG TPA: Gfo/Idh/MocA family oxidoreductase [Chthoniobacteraceae bacterium]|nr:Gfo/Idh/MocA family oxidoreductase [Chthoniobacteraceae bacterium]